MIRRRTLLAASLSIPAVPLIGIATAAPARAAASRWVSKTTYDSRGLPFTVSVSTADYGSYERINYIKWTWSNQPTLSLYPASGEFGLRLREGGSGGPIVYRDTGRWYNNTNRNLYGLICHEPCHLSADLHAEVNLWPDSTINVFGFLF